jgi:NAD(P)-dependent dehydrogenase (short-subunit alcohol dehydrogenase family)
MQNYKPKKNLLKNKIILVTGAANGIGKEVSLAYAEYGATVILLDKVIAKLEQVYDQIEQSNYPQPAIYPMDLSGASVKDYQDLADNIENEFGHLDGILHNAALLGSLMPIAQYDLEHWSKVMQINLNAPYLLSRYCLPLLNKSSSSSIIFTADDVGNKGKAYWGAYAISKAASTNLMQVMADELEENTPIRVNSINPGAVATAMRAGAYPGEDPNLLTKIESIIPSYLYLMGEDSDQINGQMINAQ